MQIYKIALLGDKDHGKSTFIGSALMLTNSISNDRINEAKRISEELGREFEPGFILDSFSEEREDAMTIDTTRAQLVYRNTGFELIDVPGHEELITNMLTGASSASTAVLLVSAKKSEGISEQTKRHLLLAKMLGISNVIVAVNKMDLAGYESSAFESIKSSLNDFMKGAQKSLGAINASFVPISAYKGYNIIKKSDTMKWYTGKPIMDLLYSYASRKNTKAKGSLRATIQGVLKGNQVACRIISGSIKKGDSLILVPAMIKLHVNRVINAGKSTRSAQEGSSPVLELNSNTSIARGSILCTNDDKPKVGTDFNAVVFFARKPGKPLIRIATSESKCRISISSEIDINTGEAKKSTAIKPLHIYRVHMHAAEKLAYEEFEKYRELGRFTIHDGNKFAGVGIITK